MDKIFFVRLLFYMDGHNMHFFLDKEKAERGNSRWSNFHIRDDNCFDSLYLVFFVNNAVYDLIKYYLQGNIANYGTDITIINLIYGYVETIIFHLRNNFVFIGALVIGGVGVLLNRKINFFVKINLLFSVIAQFLVIFLHGSMYSYYFFAFAAFVILGTSSFVQVLFGIFRVGNGAGKTFNILMAVLGVACILVALLFKPSPRQFMKDPADLAQYKFAKIMREKTDIPTLLNMGI